MDIYEKLCVAMVTTFIVCLVLLTGNKLYVEPVNDRNNKLEFITACSAFPALDTDQCIIMWYTRNAAH